MISMKNMKRESREHVHSSKALQQLLRHFMQDPFCADFNWNLRFAAETGETCVNESQLCLGLRLHTRGFP